MDTPTLKLCHAQLSDVVAGLKGVEPEKQDPKDKNSPAKPMSELKTVVSKGKVSLNSLHREAVIQMSGGKPIKSEVLVGGDSGHSNAVYEVAADELYGIVSGYRPE